MPLSCVMFSVKVHKEEYNAPSFHFVRTFLYCLRFFAALKWMLKILMNIYYDNEIPFTHTEETPCFKLISVIVIDFIHLRIVQFTLDLQTI